MPARSPPPSAAGRKSTNVSVVEMGSGAITIIEHYHLEHLVGDQTDPYQLATAEIY